MGINNINKQTLDFVFSIAQNPKTQEWSVEMREEYLDVYKKGIDIKLGGLSWSFNKASNSQNTATMYYNEAELAEKIASLHKTGLIDAAPYEKALVALKSFTAAPEETGYEILRQTNTIKIEGNIFKGKQAVLHIVEKDGKSGAETSLAYAFKRKDFQRYAFQLSNGSGDRVWNVGFYNAAIDKMGGKKESYISELYKPFTKTLRQG